MNDHSKIEDMLKGRLFGVNVHVFGTLASTNDTAVALGRDAAPEGTLVVADRQTQGKGRLGRRWDSRPGLGLWFSVILRPAMNARHASALSMVGALGVASALRGDYNLPAEVKWPNDVMVGQRKICGVLSEGVITGDAVDFAVLGVGLNVLHGEADFPEDLRGKATSVRLETGKAVARLEALASVAAALESRYLLFKARGFAGVRPALLEVSALVGKPVVVTSGSVRVEGTAAGIDDEGALVLRTAGGDRRVWAGEVEGLALDEHRRRR